MEFLKQSYWGVRLSSNNEDKEGYEIDRFLVIRRDLIRGETNM
jgi:hypothetical protein